MYRILLSLGVVVTLIGIAAVGFGVPIHEFGLGNTLIVAGAVATCGGLLLIAFAAILREIGRIADELSHRGSPTGFADLARAAMPPAAGAPAMSPASEPAGPPALAPLRAPATRAAGAPAAPSAPRAGASPAREPRAEPLPGAREPALSSRPPEPRPPSRPRSDASAGEEPAWRGSRPPAADARRPPPPAPRQPESRSPSGAREPEAPPRPEAQAGAAAPTARKTLFNRVLGGEARRAASPAREPEPAKTEPLWTPQPPAEAGPAKPALATPPASAFPAPAAEEREGAGVAVLKSGVIDGMAYTLYTDGSIEAQLPHGAMRFGSIDDLRQYLEKEGG